MHYYAFVIVSLTWLAYFLSHDYLSYINSLGFLIYFLFLSDEGPTLETLDYTIRIGSTRTFLYFDLYLYSTYAAHIYTRIINKPYVNTCVCTYVFMIRVYICTMYVYIRMYVYVCIWKVSQSGEVNQSSIAPLWRRANARNVRLYYPYRQHTDLFIFLSVSLLTRLSLGHGRRIRTFPLNFLRSLVSVRSIWSVVPPVLLCWSLIFVTDNWTVQSLFWPTTVWHVTLEWAFLEYKQYFSELVGRNQTIHLVPTVLR